MAEKSKGQVPVQVQDTKALTPRDITDIVESRVRDMENQGGLNLPAKYSPANAMKSAMLILQKTVDRDKKPVLESCTKASIMNSLLDMVVQGLNPQKSQCYFIAYGKELSCQRSYFGSMVVAKMVDESIKDIVAQVVYEGDEFEYSISRGYKFVEKHKQTMKSVDSKKPVGAYCEVIDHDGNVIYTDIMTYEEIKKAWKKSKMNPVTDKGDVKAGSTHAEYYNEMCKKTVINRTCKHIINSSTDSTLLESVHREDHVVASGEAQELIEDDANGEVIDIEPEPEAEAPETENAEPEAAQETEEAEFLQDEEEQEKEKITPATKTDGGQGRVPGF